MRSRQEFFNSIKEKLKNIYLIKKIGKIISDKICDGYIVSYPKSGRTWLSHLITNYIIHNKGSKNSEIFQYGYDPFLYSIGTSLPNIKLTHDISSPGKYEEIENVKKKFQPKRYLKSKAIFLARDPRDILISFYFHFQKHNNKDIKLEEIISDKYYGINRIIEFYNIWGELINNHENIQKIYFERLKQETENTLIKILNFFEYPKISKDSIRYSTKESSFERMQEKELERRKKYNKTTKKETLRVRKGKSKNYKNLDKEIRSFLNNEIEENLNSLFSKYK